jgi:hypothetical protein
MSARLLWFVAVLVGTLGVLAACTIMDDRALPGARVEIPDSSRPRDGGPTDPGDDDDDDPTSCTDDLPFGSPAELKGVNTAADESLPRLTADERQLFFWRFDGDAGGEIFQAKRSDPTGTFEPPTRVLAAVAGSRMAAPSADGKRLYFTGGFEVSGFSLHLSERTSVDLPFTAERTILPFTATASFLEPYLFEGPGGPELFLVRLVDESDLLRARVNATGGVDSQGVFELGELNTDAYEYSPTLSPDGRTLYFYSEREGRPSGGRIFVTRRASTTANWEAPVPLPDIPQPAAGWVGPGYVSTDNCRLYYYVSNDSFTADLWMARRR